MRRDKGPRRAADDRELSAGDAAETTALQQHLTNKIASGGKKKKTFSALDQWLSLSSVAICGVTGSTVSLLS